MALTYDRTLSEEFEKLATGPLARFLRNPGTLAVSRIPPVSLDTQLRRNDEVAIYAGLTKLLSLKYLGSDKLLATAAAKYREQPLAKALGVYGRFSLGELPQKVAAWSSFLPQARVDPAWWRGEGAWQAWLSRQSSLGLFGPAVLIDRESELENLKVNGADHRWLKDQHQRMRDAAMRSPDLSKANLDKRLGAGSDFLGVTPEGDLALLEVKNGTEESDYVVPIQLAGYTALWRRAIEATPAIIDCFRRLVEQKRRLGLIPHDAPQLRGQPDIVPMLFVGDPNLRSRVWKGSGLLRAVWNGAAKAGAPLENLRIFIAKSDDLQIENVTSKVQDGLLD